jgi:hypothetical protein
MRGDGLKVHGFRSAFRDWITETTPHPDAIAEQALAHTIDNKVERAYRRGDAFERRRDLMAMWADYVTLESAAYSERWARGLLRECEVRRQSLAASPMPLGPQGRRSRLGFLQRDQRSIGRCFLRCARHVQV